MWGMDDIDIFAYEYYYVSTSGIKLNDIQFSHIDLTLNQLECVCIRLQLCFDQRNSHGTEPKEKGSKKVKNMCKYDITLNT